MVSITYDIEIPSSIAASKMFKAMVLDADSLVPKSMPGAIKNVEILEGDSGIGTIKVIISRLFHSLNSRLFLNLLCKYRSIYSTKGEVELSEEKVKEGKEKALVMFKAIEAYLQANLEA